MRIAMTLLLLVAGCSILPAPSPRPDDSQIRPFPFPGMFTGTVPNGQLTLLIRSDGKGASCFRNSYSGKVSAGDVRYLGESIYTEDGTLAVESISQDAITARAPSLKISLRRIAEDPLVCGEFFSAR